MPSSAVASSHSTAETPTETPTEPSAETLFALNCAACHANGSNIIRRGKNLKRRAMERNGYDNVEAIATLINEGKGAMPAYADRLSPDDVSAIAQYVLTKSESGW
ncbi:MAG: c-type cytochrome [Cyanobacteria bacterium J06623_4]